MKTHLALMALLLILSTAPSAQKLSQEDIDTVNTTVFNGLQKEKDIRVTRQTKQGELSSCDIEFINVFRDFATNKGAPILVVGNLSFIYTKGKNLGYLLKVTPNIPEPSSGKWKVISAPYAAINIGKSSTKNYITKEFECENGGKCIAFSDPSLAMTDLLMNKSNDLTTLEIKVLLSKGGTDSSFYLAELVSQNKFNAEAKKYFECSIEILDKHLKDLESLK